jgi:hypothetical protein
MRIRIESIFCYQHPGSGSVFSKNAGSGFNQSRSATLTESNKTHGFKKRWSVQLHYGERMYVLGVTRPHHQITCTSRSTGGSRSSRLTRGGGGAACQLGRPPDRLVRVLVYEETPDEVSELSCVAWLSESLSVSLSLLHRKIYGIKNCLRLLALCFTFVAPTSKKYTQIKICVKK